MSRDPDDEPDEYLSALKRLELWLWWVVQGVFDFFLRVPKWGLELLRDVYRFLLDTCEPLVRYTVQFVRLAAAVTVLAVVVGGPFAANHYAGGPWYVHIVWGGAIIVALLYAAQYAFRKLYHRFKQKRAARRAAQVACRVCGTVPAGGVPGPVCRHCGEPFNVAPQVPAGS